MRGAELRRLAGRVPQPVRRLVPMRTRNAIVARFGHPLEPFRPAKYPRRVNLGAGFDHRPGYLNVDFQPFHSPDLLGDVRRLPELPTGYYEEVIAQDVLEHLERDETGPALAEWRRLLRPGGRLWLRVPDLPSLVRELDATDEAEAHASVMHRLFGTQAYTGDFHHAGFTDVLLCEALFGAGFEDIVLDRRDGWLWEGEARAAGSREPTAVAVVWGPGFEEREPADDGVRRWAGEHSSLLFYSVADTTLGARLSFALSRGPVRVAGSEVDLTFEAGSHELALELRPGATRLRLDGPPAAGATSAFPRSFAVDGAKLVVKRATWVQQTRC